MTEREPEVDHPKSTARPRLIAFAVVAIAALLGLSWGYSDQLLIHYFAAQVSSASNPAEETQAFCQLNHWVPGYRVEAKDSAGQVVQPWRNGDYDRVAAVTLSWDHLRLHRVLLGRDCLACIYGE